MIYRALISQNFVNYIISYDIRIVNIIFEFFDH